MQNRTLSTTQSEKIRNVLAQIDPEAVKSIDTYAGDDVQWLKDNWSELVTDPIWNENFESIDELIASPKSKLESIYNKNPEGLTPEQINQLVNKYDITTEDIADYYDFRKAQKEALDKFNASRYPEYKADYDKAQRAKSDSYYMSPLANEYAKEAYLKGDEKMARYNEAAGKVAGISDFAPLPLSLLGPGLRTVQRAYSDRKFPVGETVADFTGAIVPDFAEKPARFAYQAVKSALDRYGLKKLGESKLFKALEARAKAADKTELAKIKSQEDLLTKNLSLESLSNDELVDLYQKVDNPLIKSKIEQYYKARQQHAVSTDAFNFYDNMYDETGDAVAALAAHNAHVDQAKAYEDLAKAQTEYFNTADKELPKYNLQLKENVTEPHINGEINPVFADVPLPVIAEYEASKVKPNKRYDALYKVLNAAGRKAARSTIGMRRWDMFDPTANVKDEDAVIKDVISLYANEWKPYVKPANYETDPLIKAAYDKWSAAKPRYEFKVWRNQ